MGSVSRILLSVDHVPGTVPGTGVKETWLCSAENLVGQENSLVHQSPEEPTRRGLRRPWAKSPPLGPEYADLNPGSAPLSWASLFHL